MELLLTLIFFNTLFTAFYLGWIICKLTKITHYIRIQDIKIIDIRDRLDDLRRTTRYTTILEENRMDHDSE